MILLSAEIAAIRTDEIKTNIVMFPKSKILIDLLVNLHRRGFKKLRYVLKRIPATTSAIESASLSKFQMYQMRNTNRKSNFCLSYVNFFIL